MGNFGLFQVPKFTLTLSELMYLHGRAILSLLARQTVSFLFAYYDTQIHTHIQTHTHTNTHTQKHTRNVLSLFEI